MERMKHNGKNKNKAPRHHYRKETDDIRYGRFGRLYASDGFRDAREKRMFDINKMRPAEYREVRVPELRRLHHQQMTRADRPGRRVLPPEAPSTSTIITRSRA
jgi:hypothetical protein